MSKFLSTLVDKAIVPALFLVIARVAGLLLSVYVLNLELKLEENKSGLFPYLFVFRNISDANKSGTVSSGLMILVIILGASYSVYKLTTFQGRRVSPARILHLADKQKLHEIENSLEAYSRVIIWCLFSWITAFLCFVSSYKQMTPIWMNFLSFLIAFILTLFLVKNFEIDYTEK